MANWSLPLLTDIYTNFRLYFSDRLNDAAKMFDSSTTTPTNQPVGSKRWNSTANKFEKWSGSAWSDLASTYGISISGNATTATTATNVTTVTSANVVAGLGYTPLNKAGGTVTGALTVSGLITGGAGLTLTGNIYASGSIHTVGAAQFDSTLGVSGNASFSGTVYANGQIAANNAALRANGWGGVVTNGVVFFGNANSYIFKNGNTFQFNLEGIGTAVVTKGGTVAMTTDIPAAGMSKDATAYEIGSIIMGIRSSSTQVLANGTASGIVPCNVTGGTGTNPATTGTWRCLGLSDSGSKITCWQRIL